MASPQSSSQCDLSIPIYVFSIQKAASSLALCRGGETFMFTANQFRAKAAEYAELLKNTDNPREIKEFQRSKQSFSQLAHNEDWLAANFDKIIDSQEGGKSADHRTVAEIEEHILRCLGAALIMQWNTIPTKLQRELFDTAGSLGELLKTATLRGQIARFLHDHKDVESSSDRAEGEAIGS
ncbi:MAG TPA: hypothetical protein VGQ63_19590 [Pseudolabrys sp.]|jgi:hypothetical protein|nr:hypothetical protein [Pseudolabrys sp.]